MKLTKRMILPTAQIVQQFNGFDPLFEFRDEGIRGIIRDALIGTMSPRNYSSLEALIEKVMTQYESSIQYRELEYSYPDSMASVTIEYVLEVVTIAINEMMNGIFAGETYEAQREKLIWIGDDLMLDIHFYGVPACRTRL